MLLSVVHWWLANRNKASKRAATEYVVTFEEIVGFD